MLDDMIFGSWMGGICQFVCTIVRAYFRILCKNDIIMYFDMISKVCDANGKLFGHMRL